MCIRDSTKRISEKEPGLTYVECCVLGRAKVPTESDVGKLVALSSNGARVSYFKCARISEEAWLAHAGTYKESGLLDAENPFDEKDLIAKDIVADAFENTGKRVTTNRDLKYLRGLVQDSDYRWNHLVATAAFRAEEQRVPFPLDIATATAGFEKNPFRWEVDETKREVTQKSPSSGD